MAASPVEAFACGEREATVDRAGDQVAKTERAALSAREFCDQFVLHRGLHVGGLSDEHRRVGDDFHTLLCGLQRQDEIHLGDLRDLETDALAR